jgi:hypothetical protein
LSCCFTNSVFISHFFGIKIIIIIVNMAGKSRSGEGSGLTDRQREKQPDRGSTKEPKPSKKDSNNSSAQGRPKSSPETKTRFVAIPCKAGTCDAGQASLMLEGCLMPWARTPYVSLGHGRAHKAAAPFSFTQ